MQITKQYCDACKKEIITPISGGLDFFKRDDENFEKVTIRFYKDLCEGCFENLMKKVCEIFDSFDKAEGKS